MLTSIQDKLRGRLALPDYVNCITDYVMAANCSTSVFKHSQKYVQARLGLEYHTRETVTQYIHISCTVLGST